MHHILFSKWFIFIIICITCGLKEEKFCIHHNEFYRIFRHDAISRQWYRPSLTIADVFSVTGPSRVTHFSSTPNANTHRSTFVFFLKMGGGLVHMRNKKICLMLGLHRKWCNIKGPIITKLDQIQTWTECLNLNQSSGYSMRREDEKNNKFCHNSG